MENSLLRGRGQGKGFTSIIREGVSFGNILYGNLQFFLALKGRGLEKLARRAGGLSGLAWGVINENAFADNFLWW